MDARSKRRNIIVVGFMGTGKSTVSKLLAEKLGWSRLDTDEEIVRLAGKSIPEIFADEGEDRFRDLESRVLETVLAGDRQIVATGGGAVLREQNRRLMLAEGWVVSLTASRQSLLERVTAGAAAGTRPLLEGDAVERIDTLLAGRKHAYDFAHATIDTSRRTPEQIASMLVRWV
ncbi:shikimate kinase [Cohnella fermenti]|uniref:shikimate kinase n=1 Tax=Cohnella fermenti TaxID=2565925 RepID=UPI0022AA045D|nr:shikimate kinase [Cohnella fermenti]